MPGGCGERLGLPLGNTKAVYPAALGRVASGAIRSDTVSSLVVLETERLKLRPIVMADLETLHLLRQDPAMMRYMSDGHIPDEAETESWLHWHIDLWKVDGFSLFGAERKQDHRLIGWIGVTKPHWFPEMMPTPEIGWFVDRELWGQGLASEGAAAALHFAFHDLRSERIIGIYNAGNAASGRVMEKIGMSFWKEIPHPQFGFPLRICEARR